MIWIIDIASDLAVVGTNPEMADMSNPRGEIIREVFHLRATDPRGNRREFGSWPTFEAAERDIAIAPPVGLWYEGRPEYGSRAYEEYGAAEDIAWEKEIG